MDRIHDLQYGRAAAGSGSGFVADTFSGRLDAYEAPTATYISATVTSDGSTSEFSPCIQSIPLPRLNLSKQSLVVTEDSTTETTLRWSYPVSPRMTRR